MTVGRSRDAGLMIAHKTVSRHHCEVFERQGMLVVRDAGSMNGTLIDDAPIKEAILKPGHTLTIGPLTFRAEYEPADAIIQGEVPDSSPHRDAGIAGTTAAVASVPEVTALDEVESPGVLEKEIAATADAQDMEVPAAPTSGALDLGDDELTPTSGGVLDLPPLMDMDDDLSLGIDTAEPGTIEPVASPAAADAEPAMEVEFAAEDDLDLELDQVETVPTPAATEPAVQSAPPAAGADEALPDLDALPELDLGEDDLAFDLLEEPDESPQEKDAAAPADEADDEVMTFEVEDPEAPAAPAKPAPPARAKTAANGESAPGNHKGKPAKANEEASAEEDEMSKFLKELGM
ncbi:MAG: FHA domain-containing protein [Planctomycetia bacterium]|nr:FHA domain-containing protein [Planctomycetia bacterium]